MVFSHQNYIQKVYWLFLQDKSHQNVSARKCVKYLKFKETKYFKPFFVASMKSYVYFWDAHRAAR